jgi:hypothetical protein
LSLQLLHTSLFDHLIILAQFKLLLQGFRLLGKLVLHLLSLGCHSPLLLVQLVLQVRDRLRLEQNDLALLRNFKPRRLQLLLQLATSAFVGFAAGTANVIDGLVLICGLRCKRR